MSFIDDTIANVTRITGDIIDAPSKLLGQVPVVGGLLQSAVGVAQTTLPGGAAGLLGPQGPFGSAGQAGEEGMTVIQTNLQPIRALDLSVAFGGFWSGGNGQFATRTTVERLEISTGQVSIISRKPGSPHLMNSDIQAAKKVFRNVAALNKRMPRKMVKESEVTKLKNAAVANAFQNVSCSPQICAPKC